MSVTKTKAFIETNQWVIALLVASTIGVAVLALRFIPILGWVKGSALLWTVLGIFLTAIGLQTENKTIMGVLALAAIFIGSYAYLDGMVHGNEQPSCVAAEVSQKS